ncbi:hypothetical protein [Campylobacter sp. RM16187]|uniref:hypothetical protein n=1 Tax=Campylobacter sp. RM16187 TaxID=1660063 RepID=UPI0021B630DE|nr:hypothetical protein [Campylobacter sp. RM16187]QKG29219.1 hypothetical protein CDOMF_0957 [Campylobacter sp. RM16187]
MQTELIRKLKRFFEAKSSLERLESQIRDLKNNKKSYVETIERLEAELMGELSEEELDEAAEMMDDRHK